MSRKKLLIIVAATVISLLIVGIILAVSQTAGDNTTTHKDTPATSTDTDREGLHEDEGHDFEYEEQPTVASDQAIDEETIQQQIVPLARATASAYVQQSSTETSDQRHERLKTVFHPTSTALTDSPPAVDPTHSANTTSTPTVLYSRWYADSEYIVVTVAMKIVTTDNTQPQRVVSQIYQAWDVRVTGTPGNFSAYTITYNKSPIVI